MKQVKKKTAQNKFIYVAWVTLAGFVILLGVLIASLLFLFSQNNSRHTTERSTLENDGNLVGAHDETVISTVAEKVSPGVVSIVTDVSAHTMFGAVAQQAAGTGIVVSKDGYVLTNKHVISGAAAVHIVMNDGTSYENVEIIGEDPLNDIAYLKIKGASGLTAAVLGDSSTVRVGQGVIAIGNALGQYQNTVSSGIVSGKGRPVAASDSQGGSAESLTDLIQTDAAINPGNSGGPLLNRSGQVIGINTAVAAGAEGIGFAIPINATKGALKSVLSGKGVKRSYIGLRYIPLTPAVAKEYKLSVSQGAYVMGQQGETAVLPGSPAQKAGIKDGDIITKINGLSVGRQGGVSSLVGEYAPGDTVEMTVQRGGSTHTVKVTLAEFHQDS